jgi:hypothetical protein
MHRGVRHSHLVEAFVKAELGIPLLARRITRTQIPTGVVTVQNRLPLAIGFIALALVAPVAAQTAQPTPENAHGFLREVLTKGSSSFEITHVITGKIASLQSSGCASKFTGGREHFPTERGRAYWSVAYTLDIDWSKVTEFAQNGSSITIKGAMPYQGTCSTNAQMGCEPQYQGTGSSINLHLESKTLSDRVLNAMKVLKDACDTTSKYGF